MRTKKVNRYWCDYCNKAGLQAGAMRKHELHCTLNPNRKCRVCDLLENCRTPLADLMAMLPDTTAYHAPEYLINGGIEETEHYKLTEAMKAILPAFREASGNCPACMLAAMRLKKVPVPMVEGFDFKAEMKSIFDDINDAREEGRYY